MGEIVETCASNAELLEVCPDPEILGDCEPNDIGGLLWANVNAVALTDCEAEGFPCLGSWSGSLAVIGNVIPYNPADPNSLTRRVNVGNVGLGNYGPDRYIDDLFCEDGNGNPPICPRDPVSGLWDLCQGGIGTPVGDPCALYADLTAPPYYNLSAAPICMRQIGLFDGNTEVGIRLRGRVGMYRYRNFNTFGFDPNDVATVLAGGCCYELINNECVLPTNQTTYAVYHQYKPFFQEFAPVPFGTACNRRDLFPRIGTLQVDIDIRSPEIRLPYNRAKHNLVLQHPEWVRTNVSLQWNSSSVSGVCAVHGGYAHITTTLRDVNLGVFGVETAQEPELSGFGSVYVTRDISGMCPAWGPEDRNPPCGCLDNGPPPNIPQTTFVTLPDYPVIRLDFRSVD